MNYREITFETMGAAILHRWKTLVLTIVIFLALGVVSGFLFADRASAEDSGSAPEWQLVSFADVTEDLEYYNSCYTELHEQSINLFTYVNTLCLDRTMTEDQAQQLRSLSEDVTEYQQDVLSEINGALTAPDAFYIPAQLQQDAVNKYTQLLKDTQDQIVKAESAMTLLQSVGGLTSTNEDINATYASLLSQAAQYGELQIELAKREQILERLENASARVLSDSRAMESTLEQAAEELDTLGTACHQAVLEIAMKNHLDITIRETGEDLKILVNHTNRPADRQEAFTAFVLFFGLTGICAGGFFALWRESASKKERAHA